MTAKEDRLYVAHILECVRRVEADTASGKDGFFAESTQRLSQASKDKHPQIPWRNIAGFRNRLVHDYFNIDLELVWRVVTTHLADLKEAASHLSTEFGKADDASLP